MTGVLLISNITYGARRIVVYVHHYDICLSWTCPPAGGTLEYSLNFAFCEIFDSVTSLCLISYLKEITNYSLVEVLTTHKTSAVFLYSITQLWSCLKSLRNCLAIQFSVQCTPKLGHFTRFAIKHTTCTFCPHGIYMLSAPCTQRQRKKPSG